MAPETPTAWGNPKRQRPCNLPRPARVDSHTPGGGPEGIQVQELFDKQKAYFATDVTKTYEWRIDQLDRLIRMLKENYQRFADASRMDFKTACRTELLADRITQSAAF